MRFFFFSVFLLFGLTISFGQTTVQVIVEKTSVRSSPSERGAVITTVQRGEKLEVIERSGEWTKVRTPSNVGWLHGSAVRNPYPLIESIFDAERDPRPRLDNRSTGPGSGTGSGQGTGTGTGGQGSGTGEAAVTPVANSPANEPANAPLRFLHMPRPGYTEIARNRGIQGTVRLKVTFLASGQVGAIVPITELPDGLTDKAIEAAKLIKFRPQRVKGVPRTVVKPVEYSFTVY
jgi:TonB family protein